MLRFISLFFLSIVFFDNSARAGTDVFEPIYSIRQNGMGGVYAFNPSDASSFLYNPAYSCMTKGVNWTLLDVNAGSNALQIYQELQDAINNSTGLNRFSKLYGKKIWFGVGGNSTLTLPCFGFSVYDAGITTMLTHNPAFPNVEMSYLNDIGIKVGGALPIGPNLSVGLNGKKITRKGGTAKIGTALLTTINNSTLLDQFSNQGDGYGLDLGIVFRNESLPANPTISLAWQDVGSTGFIKSAGAEAPERQHDNVVFGITGEGEVPLLGFAAGLEYRHISESGMPIGKKIHLGLELSLLIFDIRVGFYQGYTSYGLGLDFWLLHFDAAYYSVERGAYAGQTPDQRILLGLNLELGFDPNFKLTDAGGKRRKLKQRR